MITIETRIYDFSSQIILPDFARIFGKISRRYFVDRHIKNIPQNDLKTSYQRTYGISSRHFNSIRSEMDGKVKASKELLLLNIEGKEEQILATRRTIAKLEKDIKSALSLIKGIETHKKKVQEWKSGNTKKKKPKILKKLRGLTIEALSINATQPRSFRGGLVVLLFFDFLFLT